ncbi:hypothetical protein LZQ00_16235 [Sphingobacterium sp. SRCM116780]|uniref:hypothetical protein n=1 Tax=Sphingobacterium sp. SRCM116780 TaxID=2907623 RepID=UPI001F224F14|nr:hypothetical protein [Sphingobacterium sp. SRCM116780]UIR55801.1 hypothetical protein LZQ00_16235 [Sphingobacterium sp. SRCM116780]
MNIKKFAFIFIGLLFCLRLTAQNKTMGEHNNWIFGPSVGYQYQSGNFLKASAWGLFAPNATQYMKIDAGANFTWMLGKTTVIPELGFTYYLNDFVLFPFVKAELTPYTVTPKVGVSIFSILDIGVGYGFDINTKKDFKPIDGATLSVGLNIPLNFHIY